MAKAKKKRPERTRAITIRVTDEEHRVFSETAAEQGLSLSAFLRLCARRAAGMSSP